MALQFLLYGPSLLGQKLLLPLDILTEGNVYLPADPRDPNWRPAKTRLLSDVVFTLELHRRLAAAQVRAGQWPLWNPYSYCGAPLLAANQAAVFSPFSLLSYALPGPQAVAWIQFCKALVAGVGAFLFFRRVLRVGYWPATFGSWCYPLTAFLVFWAGYPLSQVVLWLPWLLLATDAAVRRPGGWGGPGLALVTVAMLFAGHPAMAAALLMVSGAYFVWALLMRHGWRRLASRPALGAMLAAGLGWGLGFVLSLPQTLPALEYLQYSWRAVERVRGQVDFPPVGVAALPMLAVPNIYGTMDNDSFWVVPSEQPSNRFESVAAGYAGLLAALVLAPLAACSRRHRAIALFLAGIGLFGVAQPLDVPWLVDVFRIPPLTMTQNNRWVCVTGFAILSLAVIGLDVLRRREMRWRWWFWPPVVVLITLGGWCLARAIDPPAAARAQLQASIQELERWRAAGREAPPQLIRALRAPGYRWIEICLSGAALSGVGLALWACIGRRRLPPRRLVMLAGGLAVADMAWFAYGVNPQTDPALDFPRIPALAELSERMAASVVPPGVTPPAAALPPGRILGANTFLAALNLSHELPDIRGYDAIDPIHLVELLSLCRDPANKPIHYSALQWYAPAHMDHPELLSPIIHMLNVRYLVYWGRPPAGVEPVISIPPYAIAENRRALPRVFVPRQIEVVADKAERLARLARPDFDPSRVAYIETPPDASVALPPDAAGRGEVVGDGFDRVGIELDMQTPGLVVLADLWFPGWKAYLNGGEVPIYRANHALRGVLAPAGKSTLVFVYRPASLAWGVRFGLLGAAALGVWTLVLLRRGRVR